MTIFETRIIHRKDYFREDQQLWQQQKLIKDSWDHISKQHTLQFLWSDWREEGASGLLHFSPWEPLKECKCSVWLFACTLFSVCFPYIVSIPNSAGTVTRKAVLVVFLSWLATWKYSKTQKTTSCQNVNQVLLTHKVQIVCSNTQTFR